MPPTIALSCSGGVGLDVLLARGVRQWLGVIICVAGAVGRSSPATVARPVLLAATTHDDIAARSFQSHVPIGEHTDQLAQLLLGIAIHRNG